MSTILRFVNFRNNEFFVRSYMVQWMNIISHLTSTVNGFLVVTTKENIKENLRVFPSVVTYLVSYETMRFYRSLNSNISHVQLKHGNDTLFYVSWPSWLVFHKFYTFKLKYRNKDVKNAHDFYSILSSYVSIFVINDEERIQNRICYVGDRFHNRQWFIMFHKSIV